MCNFSWIQACQRIKWIHLGFSFFPQTCIQLQNLSLKQWLLHPKQCVYPSHWALSAVINSNTSHLLPTEPSMAELKSWVRGSSGVWPAITYAPVIWLYWLWAACCATLPGLGNIKLIIAIDRQSICHCVALGGWADGVFASVSLPSLRHLCRQQQAGLALENTGNHVFIPPIYPWGMKYTHWHTVPRLF